VIAAPGRNLEHGGSGDLLATNDVTTVASVSSTGCERFRFDPWKALHSGKHYRSTFDRWLVEI
jgi:hypothetical protein